MSTFVLRVYSTSGDLIATHRSFDLAFLLRLENALWKQDSTGRTELAKDS
jgi:hypothetical protein